MRPLQLCIMALPRGGQISPKEARRAPQITRLFVVPKHPLWVHDASSSRSDKGRTSDRYTEGLSATAEFLLKPYGNRLPQSAEFVN